MILYKYMKAEHAVSVLKNKTIKMARASSFNDIFEFQASLNYAPNDPVRYLGGRNQVLKNTVESESFLFCMTRSPINQLMWAHYGDNHKGIVLGFDVDDDFFSGGDDCIIPVQYGNIIYTKTKPSHDYPIPSDENDGWIFKNFKPENLECLQRIFLYKSADWAYEEEVRLIKGRASLKTFCDNYGDDRDSKGRFMSAVVHIPRLQVKEVYLGSRLQPEYEEAILASADRDTSCYRCCISSRSWDLVVETVTLPT